MKWVAGAWRSGAPATRGNGLMRDLTDKPTSARYVVILFAVTLAVVTYMQRHAIGLAAHDIQEDLGLDKLQMGLAVLLVVS